MKKLCIFCHEEKDINEFVHDKRRIKSANYCKRCSYLRVKKKWVDNHPDQTREITRRTRRNNPKIMLLARARQRAKIKNLPFNIDQNDIIIPDICPVLGIKLEYGDRWKHENAPSIDRIRPELGYIKGNIKIISDRANRLKNNATIIELEKIILYMRETN